LAIFVLIIYHAGGGAILFSTVHMCYLRYCRDILIAELWLCRTTSDTSRRSFRSVSTLWTRFVFIAAFTVCGSHGGC